MAYSIWHIAYGKLFIGGLSLIVISSFFGNFAWAVGVGVKPKEVNLNVRINQQTETEILIVNVSAEPAFYQVYPDALEKEIKVLPADFRLEPNESQIVKLIVKVSRLGRFATNLSVVSRPVAAEGLPAGAGVKVPVIIVASGLSFWWLVLGGIIICLGIIFGVKLKQGKNKQNHHEITG